MGYTEIAHLCHAMEDVFSAIGGSPAKADAPREHASGGAGVRSQGQTLAPRAIEILFKGVDNLSAALAAIKNGQPELSTKELIAALTTKQFPPLPEGGRGGVGAIPGIAPIEAIKVDVATLDKLMNLTEELLVERMRLGEIVRQTKDRPDQKLSLGELESSSEAFNRLISELQLNVTEARMVPLGQIFERFPRMVRDLAHDQQKEVDFAISGQDIELDRTIIDRLGEPLIHLLRNAVDHGIEKTGTIRLTALQERDKVIIAVTNEGRPIDWAKVIEVAVRRGVISKERGDQWRLQIGHTTTIPPEIENLLYKVSTKENVTETSGRGIGLSIVKSVIESLGGKVNLKSEGVTTFTLELPLTLAIIQALLVRVSDQTFALPFAQIDRSVRVSGQHIKRAFDQEVAVVEDEDIPMVRLDKLFHIGRKRVGLFLSEEEIEQRAAHGQAELMVITKRESLAGVMVDELLSTQDVVVKPLKGMLRQTKGFAGITLLGDGKPAVILDVPTLLERMFQK